MTLNAGRKVVGIEFVGVLTPNVFATVQSECWYANVAIGWKHYAVTCGQGRQNIEVFIELGVVISLLTQRDVANQSPAVKWNDCDHPHRLFDNLLQVNQFFQILRTDVRVLAFEHSLQLGHNFVLDFRVHGQQQDCV
jgi:hypothetical protein